MEYLLESGLLSELLKTRGISAHFDTQRLSFRLVRFQKGELLAAPFKPMDELLFLVRGKVNIYGLREDGSRFSVYLTDRDLLLGDMEFIRKAPLSFYAEALEEVLCVSLPTERHRRELQRDATFLNYLLRSVADKFLLFSLIGDSAQPVEEKLLTFLREVQPDHTLHGMNAGMMQLHCSRSQLQRVVRKLCEKGELEKVRKGTYRLSFS